MPCLERIGRIHRLRLAAFAGIGLSAVECDSPYPIAPTACDDWCLATQRAGCEEDYPEGCVSDCEDRATRRPARCEPAWLELTECYRQAADEDFLCVEEESRPRPICVDERVALSSCTSELRGTCLQVCLREAIACGTPEVRCEARCFPQNPGCEERERALYECQLQHPPDCEAPEPDTRDPSEIPCLLEIGVLLDCAGFDADP